MALYHEGISTFILMADDLKTMEQFAHEVVPALREAVTHELPEAFSGLKIRRAAVRAKRREGIDYDNIPASLAHAVIEPGDTGYARQVNIRTRWLTRHRFSGEDYRRRYRSSCLRPFSC